MERLTSVSHEEGAPEAMDMVRRLIDANDTVVGTAREAVRAAEEVDDPASLEKTLWMLRVTVGDVPKS
jgi:DNA-binding ferritin-like protein